MSHEALKEAVWRANMALVESGLVVETWGNASGVDREGQVMAIKPSGIDYASLKPEHIPLVSLESGWVIEGDLKPSSDTPTHLYLYQAFSSIEGVVHTHSRAATSWAQAGREIPCFGTTHADFAYGPVPLTRPLTGKEIKEDYEVNTGAVIAEKFKQEQLQPLHYPAVLVHGHGPFTWGHSAKEAVKNAIILEEIACMARDTLIVNPQAGPICQALLDKHFMRKHGPDAYYGQKKK